MRVKKLIEKTFVRQGIKKIEIEKFLREELKRAGFTKLETMKTPLVTRIIINVSNPGLAIGKSGTNIRRLTKEIEERFGVENPQIEIKEIEVPELDAKSMSDKIARLIERGYSWRSVTYRTLKDIIKAGAQGAEIILSGALVGKGQRKRRTRIFEGYMKKIGEEARLVDYGASSAHAKFGMIGVKVRIVKPETVFSDKKEIMEKIRKEEKEEKEEEVKEEKTEKIEHKEKKKTEKKATKKDEKKGKEKVKKHGKKTK